MKLSALTLAAITLAAALNGHANPAIGLSIAVGAETDIVRPVQRVQRVAQPPARVQQPLWAAPQSLQRKGTHSGIDSEMPVFRSRGSSGSLNLTHDIQLRPAF